MENYIALKFHWTHHRIVPILSIWYYDGSDFGMRIRAASRLFNAQLLLCITAVCDTRPFTQIIFTAHEERRKRWKKNCVFKSGTRSDRIRITVCAIHLTLQSKNDWNFRYRKWYNLTLFSKIEPKAEKKQFSQYYHVQYMFYFILFFCCA